MGPRGSRSGLARTCLHGNVQSHDQGSVQFPDLLDGQRRDELRQASLSREKGGRGRDRERGFMSPSMKRLTVSSPRELSDEPFAPWVFMGCCPESGFRSREVSSFFYSRSLKGEGGGSPAQEGSREWGRHLCGGRGTAAKATFALTHSIEPVRDQGHARRLGLRSDEERGRGVVGVMIWAVLAAQRRRRPRPRSQERSKLQHDDAGHREQRPADREDRHAPAQEDHSERHREQRRGRR